MHTNAILKLKLTIPVTVLGHKEVTAGSDFEITVLVPQIRHVHSYLELLRVGGWINLCVTYLHRFTNNTSTL